MGSCQPKDRVGTRGREPRLRTNWHESPGTESPAQPVKDQPVMPGTSGNGLGTVCSEKEGVRRSRQVTGSLPILPRGCLPWAVRSEAPPDSLNQVGRLHLTCQHTSKKEKDLRDCFNLIIFLRVIHGCW